MSWERIVLTAFMPLHVKEAGAGVNLSTTAPIVVPPPFHTRSKRRDRTNRIVYYFSCFLGRPCQLMHSRCSHEAAMKLRYATRQRATASSFLSSRMRTARESYLNRSRLLPKKALPIRRSSFPAVLALSPSQWPIGLAQLIEFIRVAGCLYRKLDPTACSANSDLFRPGVTTRSRTALRFDVGHHSDLKPVTSAG